MAAIPESHDAKNAKSDEKTLAEAQARFRLAEEAESENRTESLDDLKFAAGDQWDPQIKAARAAKRRPCLTINRLPQHIKQVTNDQRQNRPSIKVHPVDDRGDLDTANIYSGLIKHIEYNSNADAAYDTAFDSAVRGGLGYWRVVTQYVSPLSFDQEILIKRIRNRFSVFFDPFSQEPDGSDANFAFITEDLSEDEYRRAHPKSKLAQQGEWEAAGNTAPAWMGSKSARVAEYFYKEFREAEIVQLAGGEVVEKAKLSEFAEQMVMRHGISPNLKVIDTRTTQIPVIRWCKLNAVEILDNRDWPGSFIPIVPVYGEELDIDGKRILKGIVRDAKDPQRMLNVWKSAETEVIGLAPKAPYIADAKTIEGFEHIWATANTENHSYLPFNSRPDAPPPQRQSFEPAVQAITQAAMLAADDLKATTGIHDATLGARSNETSGVAIQRRNTQAQTSNFHFVDNLTRSLRHTGRICIDLIPHIYDASRASRIIGEDGTAEVIRLNEAFEHKGKAVTYDMSVGKYDCTVDVGPSFASKRQEAAASMTEFARAVPQVAAVTADLIAKAQDWPGSQEFAERIKKTLPPGLADEPDGKEQKVPPQIQAQIAQMTQMLEQAQAQLAQADDQIKNKRLELESKERIEFKKLEVQLEIERARIDAKDSLALLNAEISSIESRLRQLGVNQPIEDETEDQDPNAFGAEFAPVGMGPMNPTGGEAPGEPMEGIPNDDSSSF